MAFPVPSLVPPYYAIIFTSKKRNDEGYQATAARMDELAAKQPGYLGAESVADSHNGITVSYWQTEDDVRAWKQNLEHMSAQQQGREKWYQEYQRYVFVLRQEIRITALWLQKFDDSGDY